MTSLTIVELSFEHKNIVIVGIEYAGKIKKGVFTIMNCIMPKHEIFPMHSSANEVREEDVAVFFGLSGTEKTNLSADPKRKLIGYDEHCRTDDKVFNIEGGCCDKCRNLSEDKEPKYLQSYPF